MLKYNIVKKLPVARFYYAGTHTHPVRRTILIIESNRYFIRGYELREGNLTRLAVDAPIKTYAKEKIAKFKQLRKDNPARKKANQTTLNRENILGIIIEGA